MYFRTIRFFAFPVDENVAASERFDRKGVESALDKVGLMKRMAECQGGVHTSIGKEINENGIDFSGGERQKIAIARAIYKKAKI